MALNEALIEYFSTYGPQFKKGSSILVACSGGPDSVALVRSLKSLEERFPWRFHIAHVNHKLRGRESERDARFVEQLAADVRWPFHLAVGPVAQRSGNLEEKARVTRYNALWTLAERHHSSALITAHTLDDQVETVLLNLFRGTGPDGLGGIHPLRLWSNSQIPLGRPFLEVSKDEIVRFLKRHKIRFCLDRTNTDDVFLRNWTRRRLLPEIEKRNPGFKRRLAQTALLIRDEQEVWKELLDRVAQEVLRKTPSGLLLDLKRLLSYPPGTQRRLLRMVTGKDLLTFEGVEGLRRWMQSPPSNGRTWLLRKGWVVERLSKAQGSPSAHIFRIKVTMK